MHQCARRIQGNPARRVGVRADGLLVNHLLREAFHLMLSHTAIYALIRQTQVQHAVPALRRFTYRKYVRIGKA